MEGAGKSSLANTHNMKEEILYTMFKMCVLLHSSSAVSVLHLKLLEINVFPYIYFENQTQTKLFIILKGAVRFIWREEEKNHFWAFPGSALGN